MTKSLKTHTKAEVPGFKTWSYVRLNNFCILPVELGLVDCFKEFKLTDNKNQTFFLKNQQKPNFV